LKDLLISLRPCVGEGVGQKVIIQVCGFASLAEFKGLPIRESNEWNRKAANRRGKSAEQFIHRVAENPKSEACFGESLQVSFTPWRTYDERVARRPCWDKPFGQVERKAERLNRRIDVKLISAGVCEIPEKAGKQI
jgi:hypothetical protein